MCGAGATHMDPRAVGSALLLWARASMRNRLKMEKLTEVRNLRSSPY